MNRTHGNQRAVLVGDFLFARSSYLLAHLEDNEVGRCTLALCTAVKEAGSQRLIVYVFVVP